MSDLIQALTGHYQSSFELTHEMWKERNRIFVLLIGVTGIGLLLALRVPEANSLMVDAIIKMFGISDQARIHALYQSFPFDLLLSTLLVTTFYLMQKLYTTNLSVLRNYLYLGALEEEIRRSLSLKGKSLAFTREGTFYWGRRFWGQTMSKYYYIVVVLITLVPFAYYKLLADVQSPHRLMLMVDGLVVVFTLLYFVEYALSAFNLDVPKLPQPAAGKTGKPAARR